MSEHLVLDYYNKLKFDNTEMDTALAEVFLDKHNKTFKSIIKDDDIPTAITVDSANNTIVCNKKRMSYVEYKLEMFDNNILRNVSAVIRRNTELFAQLDFMIRGIPQKDVKRYDINIMADQFEYASKTVGEKCYVIGDYNLLMMEDLPMCTLAQSAMLWATGNTAHIFATKNTAAICILFAELCFEAGIPRHKMYVEIRDDIHELVLTLKNSSSIAVFTEYGDIESGVDIVFDVTTERVYPWRLRRIIVQENTYERFKRTVRSKVGSLNVRKVPIDEIVSMPELVSVSSHVPDLLEKSKDVLYYRNKLLAFDYAGYLEGDAVHTSVVLVDTYRTTKELLSLMKRHQPRYLSLWCDQISTANEIVFAIDVPNVWLNDFGLFSGPGGVAETFLKRQDYDICEFYHTPDTFLKLLRKWNTFSLKERKSALENAIEKIYDTGNNSLLKDKKNIINYIRTWNDTSSITVRDGVLCQQVKLPVGVIQTLRLTNDILGVIRTLLFGNVLSYMDGEMFDEVSLTIFSNYEIPIVRSIIILNKVISYYRLGNNQFISRVTEHDDAYLYFTKTIWSSFGETFAN